MSTENSTKPPQDNANCGDIEKRIEDYTATCGGTPQDIKDFQGLMDESVTNNGFTESAIEAFITSKEAALKPASSWILPSMYNGPEPTWIRRTKTTPGGRPVMDFSGYKIFLGGLRRHFHPREILDWLKSDCYGEDLKAIAFAKDINVVPPSQNQRSNDFKALTLRNLMEGCT